MNMYRISILYHKDNISDIAVSKIDYKKFQISLLKEEIFETMVRIHKSK